MVVELPAIPLARSTSYELPPGGEHDAFGEKEVGVGETGAEEICTGQVGAGEVASAEVGVSEVGPPEAQAAQLRTEEVGSVEILVASHCNEVAVVSHGISRISGGRICIENRSV